MVLVVVSPMSCDYTQAKQSFITWGAHLSSAANEGAMVILKELNQIQCTTVDTKNSE